LFSAAWLEPFWPLSRGITLYRNRPRNRTDLACSAAGKSMRSYTLVSVAVAMGQHQPNWHLPPVRQERYHNEDRINLNRSRAAIRAILSEGGTAFFNPLPTSRALRTARSRSSLPASNQVLRTAVIFAPKHRSGSARAFIGVCKLTPRQ